VIRAGVNGVGRVKTPDGLRVVKVCRGLSISAKFHYASPATDMMYNTTNGQKFATFQYLDMSRCWALALRCGKFLSFGGVQQRRRALFDLVRMTVGLL